MVVKLRLAFQSCGLCQERYTFFVWWRILVDVTLDRQHTEEHASRTRSVASKYSSERSLAR